MKIEELTPRQIVAELDRYIVGQQAAKRAVAIALRNRFRRQRLPEEMREEVIPKNILMIGPTGVGKTEIARRLARLGAAPFVKVEATKFTEVGYVGRDVDSMVRDLVQIAVRLVEQEKTEEVKEAADAAAVERILDLLHPTSRGERQESRDVGFLSGPFGSFFGSGEEKEPEEDDQSRRRAEQAERVRGRLKEQLLMGALDDRRVEIEIGRAHV